MDITYCKITYYRKEPDDNDKKLEDKDEAVQHLFKLNIRENIYRGFVATENGSDVIFLKGIKLRGFWVYGSLVVTRSVQSGLPNYRIIGADIIEMRTLGFSYGVLPETVCEWTGKKDCKDTYIFENDIVHFSVFDYNEHDTQYRGIVKWSDTEKTATRFTIWHDNESEYYGSGGAFDFDWVRYQDDEFEVIGNVFNDPDLAEELK